MSDPPLSKVLVSRDFSKYYFHPARCEGGTMSPLPYFREAGNGPGVVCLHSNASSSGQWRALMETLAPQFHVLAADSYGAGKSPPWPSEREVSIRDEIALLEPVFMRAGSPHALVGHSYGAALALVAAVTRPKRVRAMALYEPTLFSMLNQERSPPNESQGILQAVADAGAALEAGDPDKAAQCFIDYWMGAGTWALMPEARKEPIAASVRNVRGWCTALMNEPVPLAEFARLDIPVLYMMGADSPASSRGVGRLLARTLPRVEVLEFSGIGHMGPITHPQVVNQAIAGFLERN